MTNNLNITAIFFDLDGTLYSFKGGSFKESKIFSQVISNSLSYLKTKLNISKPEAKKKLDFILKKYGDSISIGFEREFGLDRNQYFRFAWDIDPSQYIEFDSSTRKILLNLKEKFQLALVSDAPLVWIEKVLNTLNISEFFVGRIFSGEGDIRKEFNNAFGAVAKDMKISPESCLVVGDQEETDIIPASQIGMKTAYIGANDSKHANFSIRNISELIRLI